MRPPNFSLVLDNDDVLVTSPERGSGLNISGHPPTSLKKPKFSLSTSNPGTPVAECSKTRQCQLDGEKVWGFSIMDALWVNLGKDSKPQRNCNLNCFWAQAFQMRDPRRSNRLVQQWLGPHPPALQFISGKDSPRSWLLGAKVGNGFSCFVEGCQQGV